MERNNGDVNVGRVPLSVAAVMELAPGMMFCISGGNYPARFIRIVGTEAASVTYEAIAADGIVTAPLASLLVFQRRFPEAILKYQAIVPDCQWEAFAEFLGFISRRQLDRQQVWQMYLWFQDMAIEREMAELARRKEAGG